MAGDKFNLRHSNLHRFLAYTKAHRYVAARTNRFSITQRPRSYPLNPSYTITATELELAESPRKKSACHSIDMPPSRWVRE
jgi:hypothetical protein